MPHKHSWPDGEWGKQVCSCGKRRCEAEASGARCPLPARDGLRVCGWHLKSNPMYSGRPWFDGEGNAINRDVKL